MHVDRSTYRLSPDDERVLRTIKRIARERKARQRLRRPDNDNAPECGQKRG